MFVRFEVLAATSLKIACSLAAEEEAYRFALNLA